MSEPTILILGGYGETGRRLASLLVERTRARIVIAGRDSAKAGGLASALEVRAPGRLEATAVDAADRTALVRALEGVDLLLDVTPGRAPIATIASAALDAGVDLVDLQFRPEGPRVIEGFREPAETAGRCFVAEAGFHPGVPAALVRWAAARVDSLEAAWVAGLLRQEGGIPYTPAVDDLIESFRGYRAHVLREGRWERVRFTRPSDLPKVAFDFGFGVQRTSPMDLEEVRRLPDAIPALRSVGFSVAGFDPVTDWVVSSLVMLAIPLLPPDRVGPLAKLLCWSTRTFGRPPFGCVVQLHARGRVGGGQARLALGLFHEDGYDLTAIPAVSMVEQVLDGTARRPGVHLMGQLIDPQRLLTDVEAMGVRVRIRMAPSTLGARAS